MGWRTAPICARKMAPARPAPAPDQACNRDVTVTKQRIANLRIAEFDRRASTSLERAMSRVRTIAGKIETPEREPIAQTSARTFTRRATLVAAGVGTAAAALGLAVRFNRETPRGYVAAALDIMQKYSYRQGQVDWARVRATALAEAASATTFAETYPAIRAALERL